MSDFINPYAPPAAELVSLPQNPLETRVMLSMAWQIFRARFGLITALVMTVWVPCELFSSYMDYFVFGPDDFRKSFKLAQFLYSFFGIIATAGVIHVTLQQCAGDSVSFGQALGVGLRAWPRMWWSYFLSSLILILSVLLLVLPFFYLLPRLALVESVVISEGLSGSAAIQRSQELTHGHYWKVFRILSLLVLLLFSLPFILWSLPEFFSVPDHWLLDAGINLLCDIIAAFETVVLFCVYDAFAKRKGEEAAHVTGSLTS